MAKKNANGEGSRPRKRPDGRWEGRYWSEGKRRSIYGNSRKEVADNLDALSDDGVGVFVASNITVAVSSLRNTRMQSGTTMKRRSY